MIATNYVVSITETSAVLADAYVDTAIPLVPIVDPQVATAVVQWGSVSVGIAFSNALTPFVEKPDAVYAYATVAGGDFSGRNLIPIEAVAISQQSNTPTPPTPPGAQLSFYWG